MNSPAISIRRTRHEPSEAEALADALRRIWTAVAER